MAKDLLSPEAILQLAGRLRALAKSLDSVASEISNAGMPGVELFTGQLLGRIMPELSAWIADAESEAKKEKEFFIQGTQSRSAVQRRYYMKQKQATASPPSELPEKKPAAKRPRKPKESP